MNSLIRISKKRSLIFVFLIILLFFILRFPSFFEPNWYGDEGIYQVIGKGLNAGRQFYTGVWDNKPPLLFVIYAFANGDQFLARIYSLLFGIGAIVAFYFLTKKIFKNHRIQLFSTLFFTILFGLPTIEGNIANSENFMLLPIIVCANLVYTKLEDKKSFSKKKRDLLIAGIILSLSFLIKIVSIFDFAAFVFYYFLLYFHFSKNKIAASIKELVYFIKSIKTFILGFFLPILASVILFLILGVLPYYFDAAFGRNVDYVGVANFFIIPQGLLYFRVILLIITSCILFFYRKRLSSEQLFIGSWLTFSLFNSFFSYRPYTHYLLLLLPSFSLLIGLIFDSKTIRARINIIVVISLILIVTTSHFRYWNLGTTYEYYANFVDLVSYRKSFQEYQTFFDKRNVDDYQLALYLKKQTKPKDIIFVWGNSPQVYVLSETLPPGRYSTAYHIVTNEQTIEETAKALIKTKPKYIIITPDVEYFPFSLTEYSYLLSIADFDIYELTNK